MRRHSIKSPNSTTRTATKCNSIHHRFIPRIRRLFIHMPWQTAVRQHNCVPAMDTTISISSAARNKTIRLITTTSMATTIHRATRRMPIQRRTQVAAKISTCHRNWMKIPQTFRHRRRPLHNIHHCRPYQLHKMHRWLMQRINLPQQRRKKHAVDATPMRVQLGISPRIPSNCRTIPGDPIGSSSGI